MKLISDISYGKHPANVLDLYLPEQEEFDLLIYFHGGGFIGGSKTKPSRVRVAQQVAEGGVAVASADYRLYPEAKYPDFIEDAATAVAWAVKHIGEYGKCKRIFISGSSAGGYLSMMLCFDRRWLGAHGLNPMDFDGFIHDAGQPTAHFNVLKERGLDTRRVIVDDSAPLYHIGVDEEYPPMLFIVSDNDMENRLEQTHLVLSTLKHFGHETEMILFHGKHCEHGRIVDENGVNPFAKMILEFINQ